MREVLITAGCATAGVCLGFFGFYLYSKFNATPPPRGPPPAQNPLRIPKPSPDGEERKLVVGVRSDLKLSLSDLASLGTEIVIRAAVSALQEDPIGLGQWYHFAQAKIFVKIDSAEQLEQLCQAASAGELHFVVLEHKGNPAAVAFGPSTSETLDPVTRPLKLL
jgi:peptidyl-tRNA hydrolase